MPRTTSETISTAVEPNTTKNKQKGDCNISEDEQCTKVCKKEASKIYSPDIFTFRIALRLLCEAGRKWIMVRLSESGLLLVGCLWR